MFVDALNVNVRVSQVTNRPFTPRSASTWPATRVSLGCEPAPGAGNRRKFRLQVLTNPRNRGVEDVLFVIWDGLEGTTRLDPAYGSRDDKRLQRLALRALPAVRCIADTATELWMFIQELLARLT